MKCARIALASVFVLALVTASHRAVAANRFWDINGATVGASAGTTATGTWDAATTANWTTDSTGASATSTWVTTDTAVFSAGTNATGSSNITISGTITAAGLTVEEGTINLTGTGAASLGANNVTVATGTTLSLDNSARIATTAGSKVFLDGSTLRNTVGTSAGTFFDTDSEIVLGAGGGTFSHTTANNLNIVQTATKITGTGSLTKTGAGVLAIASTAGNNTYSGGTIVNDGELRMRTVVNTLPTTTAVTVNSPGIFNLNGVNTTIGSLSGAGSVGLANGTLTVGDATSTTYSGLLTDTANAGASGSTAVGGNVTKVGAGTLTIQGNDWSNTGTTAINGGAIQLGNASAGLGNGSNLSIGASGTYDMNGFNDTVRSIAGAGAVINGGNLTLAGTNTSSVNYSGNFSGTAANRVLTKNGTGIQIFSGSNDWTAINQNGGDLRFNSANASGASGGASVPITVGASVAVDVTGAAAGGAIGSSAAGIVVNNPMSLTAGSNMGIFSTSGNSINFAGKISGAGALSRSDFGAGTVTLSGDNDFAGGVTLISRSLTLGHRNALGTGTLTVGHATQAPGTAGLSFSSSTDLSGANAVSNNVVANRAFSVTGNNNLELSGQLTGSGSLTKEGNGTLTLSGNDATYTGAVTVNGGAVLVNGTLGTSGVTVNSSGTVGGTGTIAGNLTFVGGGTIAPGSSPGTISLGSTGSLIFDPGTTLAFELNGGNTTEGGGVNDLIDDVAALTLDGTLNVSDSPNPGSFATATAGSSWRLINYSGVLSDMGLTLGSMPTLDPNLAFAIDTSITGQVNLLVTAIPEASAFLFGGLVASVVAGRVAMKRLRRKA